MSIAKTLLAVMAMMFAFGATAFSALAQGEEGEAAEPEPEWRFFASASIASHHVGAEQDFEEFNPGITFGAARARWGGAWETGAEIGVFRNSYGDTSPYGGVYVDRRVLDLSEDVNLRLGLFAGYADYPQLVDEAEDNGALVVGDFVPIISGQASLRVADALEFRTRFGPGLEDAEAIFAFQFTAFLPH